MSTPPHHVHVWRGQRAKSCECGVTPDQECPEGHPRTEENAYRNARGMWACRVCRRTKNADWRANKRTPEQHEAVKARMRDASKKLHRQYRAKALEHYGTECACCGEAQEEFLCIDHVNNNGSEHRAEIKGKASNGGSLVTYRWLSKNGYPEGFQTLCHNCNFAKHVYGTCPHGNRGNSE